MKKKQGTSTTPTQLFTLEEKVVISTPKAKIWDQLTFDLIDALQGPCITFSESWKDTIPKRLLNILPMARMVALLKKEEAATYEECCAYLYTRTLEAPMSHEWTQIYLYVSCLTCENWFKEDQWNLVNAPKKLDQYLQSKLNGLRQFIYDKRRLVVRNRMKAEDQKNPLTNTSKPEKIISAVQQELF